jgi:PAS domain S-box-containing protein
MSEGIRAMGAADPAEVTGWLLEGRFLTVDARGAVTLWSPLASEAFGWSRKDIVGSSFVETLVAEPDRDAPAERLHALLAGHEDARGFSGDVEAVDQGGDRLRLAFAAVPIHVAVGYEFNGILQEIASSARSADSLAQLKARKQAVLSLIDDALRGRHAELGEAEGARRLAGALIVFRTERAAAAPAEVTAGRAAEQARAEAETARIRMAEAVKEAERLRGELIDARGEAVKAGQLAAELAQEREQAERSAAELAAARRELADARAELARRAADVEAAQARIEAMGGELATLSGEATTARAETERARAELAELTAGREATERDASGTRTEIAAVRAELETERAHADSLEATLRTLSTELAEAHAGAERLRAELDRAGTARPPEPVAPTADRGEVERLAAERDAARARAEAVEAELSVLGSEIAAARADRERTHADLAAISERAEASSAEVSALRAELESARAQLASLAPAAAEVDRLRADLEAVRAELAEASERRDEATAEARALEAELTTSRVEGERATAAAGAELARLTAELEATRAEVEWSRQRAERATSAAGAEIAVLTAELEQARVKPAERAQPPTPPRDPDGRPIEVDGIEYDYWQPAVPEPAEASHTEPHEPLSVAALHELAHEVDAKNRYTAGHAQRVAAYAVAIGESLDLPAERVEAIREAALLHDIGKTAVPDAILAKDEPLNLDELDAVERHSEVAHAMLSAAGLDEVAGWVRHVHERFDGAGFPSGLAGGDIPQESRILHAADALDHMTRPRAYRRHRPLREALAELRFCAGTRVDPEIAERVIELVESESLRPELGSGRSRSPVRPG